MQVLSLAVSKPTKKRLSEAKTPEGRREKTFWILGRSLVVRVWKVQALPKAPHRSVHAWRGMRLLSWSNKSTRTGSIIDEKQWMPREFILECRAFNAMPYTHGHAS